MNFQGEYNNTIDPKGRASIPARFRDVLAEVFHDERLVVTKNWEDGLSAYPAPHWDAIVEKVQNWPPGKQKTAAIQLMVAPAVVCSFDKQGRILVPEALRAHAGLQKEIVVVGMLDKIDIYSQSKHAEVTGKAMAFVKEDPQFMADMGF
jgi:MraZ protein